MWIPNILTLASFSFSMCCHVMLIETSEESRWSCCLWSLHYPESIVMLQLLDGRWIQMIQRWRIGLAPFAQLQFFGVGPLGPLRSILHQLCFSDTRHLLKQAANRCPPAALLKPECTSWTVFPMHFEPMVLACLGGIKKTLPMACDKWLVASLPRHSSSAGPPHAANDWIKADTNKGTAVWKPHSSSQIAWAKRSAASLT